LVFVRGVGHLKSPALFSAQRPLKIVKGMCPPSASAFAAASKKDQQLSATGKGISSDKKYTQGKLSTRRQHLLDTQ